MAFFNPESEKCDFLQFQPVEIGGTSLCRTQAVEKSLFQQPVKTVCMDTCWKIEENGMSLSSKTLVKLVPLEGKRSELKSFTLTAVKEEMEKVDGLVDIEVNENEQNGDLYLCYTWESREKVLTYVQGDLYRRIVKEVKKYIKVDEKTIIHLTHLDL